MGENAQSGDDLRQVTEHSKNGNDSGNSSETLDKIWLNKIKNNRIAAFLIVIGVVVAAVTSFSDNVLKLVDNSKKILPVNDQTAVINTNASPASNSATTDTNMHVVDKASDVVDLKHGDINVVVGINNSDEADVQYVVNKVRNGYEISPMNAYLSLLAAGGPMEPKHFWHSPFQFQLPDLDFKITNNTSKTVFFTQAILQVRKSVTDPYPVLVMNGESFNMSLNFMNIGWGKVMDCKVNFNLSAVDTNAASYDYHAKFKYEKLLGDFDKYPADQNLRLYLFQEGVDTFTLDHTSQYVRYQEQGVAEKLRKAVGPYTNSMAYVYGVVSYNAMNASGSKVPVRLKFKSVINMGESGVGAPAPPSYTYKVALEADKSNYTRTVNVSQALKPGEFDRFNLSIGAPKSSVHDFDLILVYDDNKELKIPNIHLNYFMSTLDAYSVHDEKNGQKGRGN